jgi:hypothetical protein
MSTLSCDTITDKSAAESVGVENLVHGTVKVWCHYNQVTPAITDSFNVSSVDDDAAGDSTVNLTNAMSDALFLVIATANNGAGGGAVNGGTTVAATDYNLFSRNLAGTPVDFSGNMSMGVGASA